jgi:hypothetical protein
LSGAAETGPAPNMTADSRSPAADAIFAIPFIALSTEYYEAPIP